ncbi:MAG TPA: polyphosphate kinase 1 [Gemmatimonadales bacterium]|nr:polyphosphate kinase 1 [Gemmatimonadales bacterium]
MAAESQFRCDVSGPEALAALRDAALPARLLGAAPSKTFHRDIYLDTNDRTLQARGASCRVRIQADDHRILTLFIAGGPSLPVERYEAEVAALDPRQALLEDSEPARRLRGLIDPAQLRPRIELEVERWTRIASSGWFRRVPRFAFLYDACTVRHAGLTRNFEELQVRRIAPGGPRLDAVSRALERQQGLRPLVVPRHQRAAGLVEVLAAEAATRKIGAETAVVMLALDQGNVGFLEHEGGHALPVAQGSGEEAMRHLLRTVTGSSVGTLSLLTTLPPTEDRDALEVWVVRRIRGEADGLHWLAAGEAIARIGTPAIRTPETLAALAVATRASLLAAPGAPYERMAPPPVARVTPRSTPVSPHFAASPRARTDLPQDRFFNVELAQLGFNQRVLELAEDPGTPLAERLRFLAIVSGNLDEFFSVRVGALKAALLEGSTARSFDGLSAREQLEAIAAQVPSLLDRQARCLTTCLAASARVGVRLRGWDALTEAERTALVSYFESELFPVLTPRAMTMSPGHPFPVIPQFVLTFGVVVQDVSTGPIHFATLPIRARLDRFVKIPGSDDVILLEEIVRANIQAFYRDRPVEGAWLFRITRAADLEVDDEAAGDLLQAIEEEVGRRPGNAPVRVEAERSMPEDVREMLLRELRFERRGAAASLGAEDFYSLDTPLDLSALRDFAVRLPAAHSFPLFQPRKPLAPDLTVFEQIDRGDILVHHPYDDFGATVGRFLEEAAVDPEVLALKMTLYRLGDQSLVADALLTAAQRGKDVTVLVELKARFDESRNVGWVRKLEEAGAQVIYGMVGLKTHAKVALVVRKTTKGVRRYAHIGTGNYNASTSRFYTDLGLLTADAEITADLTDLFNQLTGSSREPGSSYRKLLVAPGTMLKGFLDRIDREIGQAKAGKGGRIRVQINGLEDPEITGALYRASEAGVEVSLLVRSLSVLRPGVPGVSDRIRVLCVLGRFLEHERIYHFGNGGADEYLIGSADWRPRNLRRRVEVVTPVSSPPLVARLDALLTALFAEPSAWTLGPDGAYVRGPRPSAERPHLHDRLLA